MRDPFSDSSNDPFSANTDQLTHPEIFSATHTPGFDDWFDGDDHHTFPQFGIDPSPGHPIDIDDIEVAADIWPTLHPVQITHTQVTINSFSALAGVVRGALVWLGLW